MTISVRPCAMRSRLALTMDSLSASRALVASSRISIRGSPISARDRQTLALTARQIGRAFLDEGLVAARQLLDEFLGPGEPRRLHDLLEAGVWLRGGNRVADRTAEQEIFLQHDAKARAQMIDVDLAQVVAVDLDQSLVIAVQQLQ